MPGFPRRPKPLKARVSLDDLAFAEITNLADGDILVYDATDGVLKNTQVLDGAYTFTQGINGLDLTLSNSLVVGNDATIGDDLTVLGDTALQALLVNGAATFSSTLHVTGAATFDSTVNITGTLAFAGFSVSGNGNIAGNLSVGGTLSVTGATTLASTLSVAGNIAGAGNLLLVGNASVVGALTAGSVSASTITGTTVSGVTSLYGGTLTVGAGATYTDNGITFYDDGTTVDILNGTTTILSSRTTGILEGSGDPNGVYTANPGSLYRRTDGYDANTLLYIKVTGTSTSGWASVLGDTSQALEYLFLQMMLIKQALLSAVTEDGVGIIIDGDDVNGN